jgi:hypothetical protein
MNSKFICVKIYKIYLNLSIQNFEVPIQYIQNDSIVFLISSAK